MARRNDQERPHKLPPGWRLPEEKGASEQERIEEMSLEELEAETKRLQWEQTKAEYERLAEQKRSREGGTHAFGLASNQRRYFGEFTKKRPLHW